MTGIIGWTDRRIVRIGSTFAGIGVPAIIVAAITGCSDNTLPTSPAADPVAAFGKGTFDGPKSVPTRGRLYFSSDVTGDMEIYSMNEDGSGLVRLTYSPGLDFWPAVSPDGRTVVFMSDRSGNYQLWTMRSDGSQTRQLTQLPHPTVGGAGWSPDGRHIAFGALGAGVGDLYIMNSSGSAIRPLYTEPSGDQHPRFSPDGTRIAFSSSDAGSITALSVDLNGADVQTLCPPAVPCVSPAWSPDGQMLVFVATGGQIVVRNLTTLSHVTIGEGFDPAWSPDGLKIAFAPSQDHANIATVNADGSDYRVLTSFGAGTVSYMGSWSR